LGNRARRLAIVGSAYSTVDKIFFEVGSGLLYSCASPLD